MSHRAALPIALTYALSMTALSLYIFWAEYPHRDFTAFYLSVSDYWNAGSLYAPHVNQNLNPPHFSLVLFTPVLVLPMPAAAIAWFVCSAAMIAASLAIIRKELELSRTRTWWLVAAVCASAASQHNLDQGQIGAVLMLLATLAWRSARRGRSSAPWLACVVSIKPPLAPWMFAQHRKDAVRTIAIGAMALGIGVAAIGPDNWRGWFEAMNASRTAPVPSNLSVFGFLIRTGWSTVGELPWGWLIVFWAAASTSIGVVTWKAPRVDVDHTWLMWGLTAILVSPVGWNYYLLAVTGPLAAWVRRHDEDAVVQIALLLLMLPTQAVVVLWILHPILGSIYTLAALILWKTVIYRRRQAPDRASGFASPDREAASPAAPDAARSPRGLTHPA